MDTSSLNSTARAVTMRSFGSYPTGVFVDAIAVPAATGHHVSGGVALWLRREAWPAVQIADLGEAREAAEALLAAVEWLEALQ